MANSPPWLRAANPPALAHQELHVWRASLEVPPGVREYLEKTLNPEEKNRVERILIPQGKEHFIAARGILRELAGAYLGVDPQAVIIDYGPQGKPRFAPGHKSNIQFNISHSLGMGLFVFAREHEVGVDIEYIKSEFGGMEIARQFFSNDEVASLASLPAHQQDLAFFNCWTRKEAYVKAHGEGLSVPLESFSVDFNKREQTVRDQAGVVWSCYALEAAQGFAGAVVAEGENWTPRYWEWSPR